MKRYHILDLKSDSRKVVIATSYVSPLSQVYAIAHELKSNGYKGEVIFDLLLSNGFSSNRFLKTDFDGEQLNIGKIEVLSKLKNDILDQLYVFFYEHPQYVKASSLPEPQKYVLLNRALVGEITGVSCS
ncbi:type II toxin-antitoxin system RnlB family antitoxin [Bacillus altitudinis]|uniref:type II toxin-antitoxin system RnlB family antitoxin n=1 Tax=Bacillus altitudinis TaxID=293387 RepID=UPI002235BBB5|nr:type II toxin-antitoxin system RnlB family antitoxin [Bacillus altitudinis]MCW4359529.1 type II toxin-antitoxin system RnlB family antitoxin [Bacillus altitudinis]